MICLVLGLLMNSSSCSERKGDQLPIINTMFINYSTYNLTFNYGNSLEHIIKLNANDTIRKCDTLNSLVDWLASGNHNKLMKTSSLYKGHICSLENFFVSPSVEINFELILWMKM